MHRCARALHAPIPPHPYTPPHTHRHQAAGSSSAGWLILLGVLLLQPLQALAAAAGPVRRELVRQADRAAEPARAAAARAWLEGYGTAWLGSHGVWAAPRLPLFTCRIVITAAVLGLAGGQRCTEAQGKRCSAGRRRRRGTAAAEALTCTWRPSAADPPCTTHAAGLDCAASAAGKGGMEVSACVKPPPAHSNTALQHRRVVSDCCCTGRSPCAWAPSTAEGPPAAAAMRRADGGWGRARTAPQQPASRSSGRSRC